MANETSSQGPGRGDAPARPKYPPPKPPPPTDHGQGGPPRQPQGYAQGGHLQQGGYPQQQGGYPQQGYAQGVARAPAQPSAYWPLTIISFICSFLFGAIAMYFSAQVGSRWRAGNAAGAEKASRMALIWGLVGIAVGLIVFFAVLGSADTSGY
jgi:Interferon-induced transmembrane protein